MDLTPPETSDIIMTLLRQEIYTENNYLQYVEIHYMIISV